MFDEVGFEPVIESVGLALLMFNQQQIYLFSQIQTSQTEGQPYSDTSPHEVTESSLIRHWAFVVAILNDNYFY